MQPYGISANDINLLSINKTYFRMDVAHTVPTCCLENNCFPSLEQVFFGVLGVPHAYAIARGALGTPIMVLPVPPSAS